MQRQGVWGAHFCEVLRWSYWSANTSIQGCTIQSLRFAWSCSLALLYGKWNSYSWNRATTAHTSLSVMLSRPWDVHVPEMISWKKRLDPRICVFCSWCRGWICSNKHERFVKNHAWCSWMFVVNLTHMFTRRSIMFDRPNGIFLSQKKKRYEW